MGPRTTHIYSQTVYYWLDGGSFVSSQSNYYQYMSHSDKDRSFYSFSQKRNDKLSTYGDSRGSVGPRTTQFSSQKVSLSTDRHDGWFQASQNHHIASPTDS